VSTHLGRLREAGFVRDRRQGTQCFYALAADTVPDTVKALLDEASKSADPTLVGDQKRLQEFEAERRGGLPESVTDDFERDYSPGRTWKSLALGIAAFLKPGTCSTWDRGWRRPDRSPFTAARSPASIRARA
jgi:ArsR family transcriptional regulator